MKNPRTTALLATILLAAACTGGEAPPSDPGAEVRRIADDVWAYQLEHQPYARLLRGEPVETLPDLSYERAAAAAELARSTLERLAAIDEELLDHDDWLTYRLLERQARMTVEGLDYYWFTNVLTPYSSAAVGLRQLFQSLPIVGPEDVDRYLRLLGQVPGTVRQVEDLARAQAEVGYVVPEPNLPAATGIVRAVIQPAEAGPFAVATERLTGLEDADVARLQSGIQEIVDRDVNPALERLLAYLEGEYAQAAPEGVGLAQYPGGEDYYRYLVRLHTTLEVTPEEVQEVGREMIADMQASMAEIQAELGFEGTAAEFREHLLGDPASYPQTPEEVGDRLLGAAEAFFARADELFPARPAAPFGVRRLDPSLEGSQTYGYYNIPTPADPRGYYHYNGSHLEQRSWLPLKGIGYHELFPGHHFQIALQTENERLHPFRRYNRHTAYTEGWGSYSSLLGLEASATADPLDRYGVYMLEVFLANRLVVDPGMSLGTMSLEEARRFMTENTFESPTQIATETLRYSTDMPGQALAYQMGKRTIVQLRERARQALGDRFDLREFHGAILGPGSLPLTVLAEHIDWWIDQAMQQAANR